MSSPIGIYDSGIGGLTVLKQIRKVFPGEDLVYFGDTARVPYGPKSKQTVIEYSIQNTRFLLQLGVKIVIIACNTSSALALDVLTEKFDVPIFGVTKPGAERAVAATKNKKIGVIGTEGTIKSGAYTNFITQLDPSIEVFSKACPLFVSLVEEGWEKHNVSIVIAKEYLSEIYSFGIDTLVLGCTHYPVLKSVIRQTAGDKVVLIDSAEAISENLKELLKPEKKSDGKEYFYVSDNEDKFKKMAAKILGQKKINLNIVKLREMWSVDR